MAFAESAIGKLRDELKGYETNFWDIIDDKDNTGFVERDKIDNLVQAAREK